MIIVVANLPNFFKILKLSRLFLGTNIATMAIRIQYFCRYEYFYWKGNYISACASCDLVGVGGDIVARVGGVAHLGGFEPHISFGIAARDSDAYVVAVVADYPLRVARRLALGARWRIIEVAGVGTCDILCEWRDVRICQRYATTHSGELHYGCGRRHRSALLYGFGRALLYG